MKLTQEKIDHLQQLTGVEAYRAQEALEECSGDELESLLWMESRGWIADGGVGRYTTAEGTSNKREILHPARTRRRQERVSSEPLGWGEHIWMLLVGNRLIARHKEDPARRIECPLGALVALLIIAWHVVALVMVAGVLTGWRYQLVGPQLSPLSRRIASMLRDDEKE